MASRRSGYSRFVGFVAFGLLGLAALLLIALFYISKPINIDSPAPIPGLNIAALVERSGMGAPEFVGRTEDGSTLRMNADRTFMVGAGTEGLSAEKVRVVLERDGAQRLALTADYMDLPQEEDLARFTGNVVVQPGDALNVTTDELTAALDLQVIASPGPIEADGAFGRFTAGNMTATQTGTSAEPTYLTVFQGGVRLIYTPPKAE